MTTKTVPAKMTSPVAPAPQQDSARSERRHGWIGLASYGLTAGTVAVAMAQLVGLAAGRTTGRGALAVGVVQLAVALALVGTAGYFADSIIARCRREFLAWRRRQI